MPWRWQRLFSSASSSTLKSLPLLRAVHLLLLLLQSSLKRAGKYGSHKEQFNCSKLVALTKCWALKWATQILVLSSLIYIYLLNLQNCSCTGGWKLAPTIPEVLAKFCSYHCCERSSVQRRKRDRKFNYSLFGSLSLLLWPFDKKLMLKTSGSISFFSRRWRASE